MSDPTPIPPDMAESHGAITTWLGEHTLLRRGLLALCDALIIALAFALAYQVRFDFDPRGFNREYRSQYLYVAPFLVAVRLICLWRFGLYRGFSRYTGIHELINIVFACGVGTLGMMGFYFASNYIMELGGFPLHWSGHLLQVPRGVILIDTVLAMAGVAGIRLARRVAAEQALRLKSGERRRVVIVGASDAGEQVARDLLRTQGEFFKPVAFVDPNPAMTGSRIHGLPVAGVVEQLGEVTKRYRADMLVIALPRTTPAFLREIVDLCRETRLEFKIIPPLDSVIRGDVQISQLRAVEIEDLLGRAPVNLGHSAVGSYLAGKRLLVTGAGGSIGSELCRQVMAHRPARLALLGRGENSLYEIEHELRARAAEWGVALEVIIGDVRDEFFVRPVFERLRPQIVFHAAAHKHVHYMEAQPAEAVKNNVRGTRLCAEAAIAVGAERFIMISTDKAVRPRGVMGASKRAAELITSALNETGPTRFVAVRFGNVLGSRGSVIPLFRKQIAAGGPVTVTHEDVTRYFMTIPEAVSLVIEAGAVGEGGEVFLLDMGQPIRIVDLARQLITLSGLEPGRDIEIRVTGLRPGEKIHEELHSTDQDYLKTRHDKIWRLSQTIRPWGELEGEIKALEALADAGIDGEVFAAMETLIPEYERG